MNNKKAKLESLGVKFQPININELRITFPSINYEIEKDGKNIDKVIYEYNEISVGDRYICSIGDFVVDYKVNNINVSRSNPKNVSVKESEYNTSTLFILPLLFKNRQAASYISENTGYLLNTFINCSFIQAKDLYSVFILVKFSKSERFKIHEEFFINHNLFVKKEDVTAKYVVYEFSIPDIFKSDYDLLVQGKYSKLSDKAKGAILGFHENTVDGSAIEKIINRAPELVRHYEEAYGMSMKNLELYKKIDNNDILTKDLL